MNSQSPEIHHSMQGASGQVSWESPANIALIKYWGKHPVQLPMNPSLSFVLKKSVVRICIDYAIQAGQASGFTGFLINGRENKSFSERIALFLRDVDPHFSFLKHATLKISSESTFPPATGIASSAAAFSALALCLCSVEAKLNNTAPEGSVFFRKASNIARLGSGSACRSVYPGMVVWGQTKSVSGSDDHYAIPLKPETVAPVFHSLQDSILIVNSSPKKVSSSKGHAMMHHHPYREARKEQAFSNLDRMLRAMQTGDLDTFGEVTENEALSLHSMMMSSSPGYVLMHPNTFRIIELIREFRRQTAIPAYFTLDAGPNIHMIYPQKEVEKVRPFIKEEVLPLCEDGKWIDDGMGNGPRHEA